MKTECTLTNKQTNKQTRRKKEMDKNNPLYVKPGRSKRGKATEMKTSKEDAYSLKKIFFAVIYLVIVIYAIIEIAKVDPTILSAVVVLSVSVIAAGIYSIYVYFAPREMFWGIDPEEGKVITVVKGGEEGRGGFVKAVMSCKGYKFDKDWNIVKDETYYPGKKTFLERIGLGGIFRIGWYKTRRIDEHSFIWDSVLPKGELKHHEGTFKDMSLKEDTYGLFISKVESKESMVPIDVTVAVTARIENPVKARYRVADWLQNTLVLIEPMIVVFIAKMDNPRELIGNEGLMDIFFKELQEDGLVERFINRYGVEVSRVNVVAIELDEDAKDAAKAKWTEERNAEALIVKKRGEGEAYRVKLGQKEKADEEYYRMVQKFEKLGTDMQYFETARESNNVVIPPIGAVIGAILKQAFVKNESSDEIVKLFKEADITAEDIRNAIEVVKAIKADK